MKAIIIIYFYVALLPSIIHGVSGDESIDRNNHRPPVIDAYLFDDFESSDEEEEVDEMALVRNRLDEIMKNGENISNIFKPSRLIDNSFFRIIYEGKLFRNNKMVAMKFKPSTRDNLRTEYEMYTYLNAIDNATVENYGIPAVYYYGEWDGYRMLAITLLDRNFHIQNDWSDLNALIIFREFVRISKYIHSCGVYHRDSRYQNIMLRGNKVFMIDFNWALKVTNRYIEGDCRKNEWKHFLVTLCMTRGLYTDIIAALPERGLKKVLLTFAEYIRMAEKLDYDGMYDIITEEIRWYNVQEPALASWLTDAQHTSGASAESSQNQTPDIRAIPDPYTAQFDYQAPNYAYFGSINAD